MLYCGQNVVWSDFDMNCMEAQSYIMPFIEGKVPERKQEEFVMHMKNCPKCHEELEIYYTLIVGMKQLDNKEELSSNFSQDLENGLNRLQHRVKGRRRVRFSTFSAVCLAIIAGIILLYGECLNRVYAYEQDTKLLRQGEHYFYRELEADLLLPDLDRVADSQASDSEQEQDFYEKIHRYNLVTDINDQILKLGGDLSK